MSTLTKAQRRCAVAIVVGGFLLAAGTSVDSGRIGLACACAIIAASVACFAPFFTEEEK